ncbi:hypothetical protein [Dawidia soli]|uniref:3-keto-disaccharide hydrolase domain-containing protein n=1 Tax=Dawidia soli TaxID=2782352 RepID=A0AAP2D824_9BACT|nr:hypothetical protein [Dawidia soli]MBT1687178.1 hypothetical protein [Dawidia soli]
MNTNVKSPLLLVTLLALTLPVVAQQIKSYDLQQLTKERKFDVYFPNPFSITDTQNKKQFILLNGLAWITGEEFSTGTIEVDLKGYDVFQMSFLGVAFHGVDSATYDLVYFRPFNFRAEDPVRKIHAVQYVSQPDYPWNRLRDEQNGIYEKAVTPAPAAEDWFHARIEVGATDIKVYVDHATTPSLVVKKLNNRKTGRIGLWNNGISGAFANLKITRQ